MMYVSHQNVGGRSLYVVKHWFSANNAALFSLMVRHMPLPFGDLSRSMNLSIGGFTKLDIKKGTCPSLPFHKLVGEYFNKTFVHLHEEVRSSPCNSDMTTRCPTKDVTLRNAWEHWCNTPDLIESLRFCKLPGVQLELIPVPIQSDSLVIFAGPHRVSNEATKRCAVYIHAVDAAAAPALLSDGYEHAVANSLIPPTAQGSSRSQHVDEILSKQYGEWGWNACTEEVRRHLVLTGTNESKRFSCDASWDERCGDPLAGMLTNSYVVIPNVLGAERAQQMTDRILHNVAHAVCDPLKFDFNESRLFRGSDGRMLDLWKLIEMTNANPEVTPRRRALYNQGQLPTPHFGVWKSHKIAEPPSPEYGSGEPGTRQLVWQNVYQVLKKGMLDAHYDPVIYTMLTLHVAPLIAHVLCRLRGLEETEVMFAPERMSAKYSKTKSGSGLDWHIDMPCAPENL
jgi:hypothetical protein